MKYAKKIMSLILIACLVVGLCVNVSAAESNYSIVLNNEMTCVVKEITSDGVIVATNNKESGILTIEKYDSTETNLLSTESLDLKAIIAAAEEEINQNNEETVDLNAPSTRASYNKHTYQHTFSNREYDCYFYTNYVSWVCRSGDDYKNRQESSTNAAVLESFRNAVENVNTAELSLAGVIGGTAVVAVVSALLTGGIAAAIAAAGGISGAAGAIVALNSAINNADYYFARL